MDFGHNTLWSDAIFSKSRETSILHTSAAKLFQPDHKILILPALKSHIEIIAADNSHYDFYVGIERAARIELLERNKRT